MKYILILLFSCFIMGAQAQQSIIVQKYNLPLLKGKANNPVLRVCINNEQRDQYLDAVTVLFEENYTDVESSTLYSTGADSSMLTAGLLKKAVLFSTATVTEKLVALKGKLKLKKGVNYFWLSIQLTPSAALTHLLNISVKSVLVNRTIQDITEQNVVSQRIGLALKQQNDDQVFSHRIPGLATAKDGTLLAIYDARYDSARDLQGNMDIGLSRSVDHGKTWLPMQIVLDMGKWGGLPEKFNGVSDACILTDTKTGTIYIAGLWMHGVIDSNGKWVDGLTETSDNWNHQWKSKGSQPGFDVKQTAQFLIVKSTDNGKTWGQPVNLTKMCKPAEWWLWAPAPGQGITLKDGTLVFPTQGRDARGKPFSNITFSKDQGKTWKTSKPATNASTTENMAVELSDGAVMLNMRANSNRTDTSSNNGRAVFVTTDLGENWAVHPTSHKALREPTCMASIIRQNYKENGTKKSMLIFCNPDSKTSRSNISLKVSYDDGNTWHKKILLDEFKGRGYSCLTSIDSETLGVLYESSQADLVFQTISLKELL